MVERQHIIVVLEKHDRFTIGALNDSVRGWCTKRGEIIGIRVWVYVRLSKHAREGIAEHTLSKRPRENLVRRRKRTVSSMYLTSTCPSFTCWARVS
jgi:hypothetical protein